MKYKSFSLFSFIDFIIIVLLAIFYIGSITIVLNLRIFLSAFPFMTKAKIFFYLLEGLPLTFGLKEGLLLLIDAILVGCNVLLTIKTIKKIRHGGKLRVSIGGLTLIMLLTSGCAACGLSIISVLGIGSALYTLFWYGSLVQIISTILLCISALYMFRKLLQENMCKRQES